MAKSRNMPTMLDVAREAGVALGTVSKVVNHQPVGEEFRQKVEKAIDRLGYQYNSSGKALRTDSTNTIALIIPNTVHPFFALLANYITMALDKRHYRTLLCFTDYDVNREMEMIQLVRNNRVDGIIGLTYNPALEIPDDIPFVTIDRFFSESIPCIASDNFEGGRLAARKLYELGCRKMAFMRVGSTLVNEPAKRRDGFVSACVELGASFEVFAISDGTPDTAFDDFIDQHIIGGHFAFDGLFCGTDTVAYRSIRHLKALGIRVPEDVQVIGFDGIRMFGNQDLICSTIVQPVQEIAETCVSTVLSKHMSTLPSLICLPVHYAKGGTTRDCLEEIIEEEEKK